jgi:hypothetical protein
VRAAERHALAGLAVGHEVHAAALLLEPPLHELPDRRIVFDDEDLHARKIPAGTASRPAGGCAPRRYPVARRRATSAGSSSGRSTTRRPAGERHERRAVVRGRRAVGRVPVAVGAAVEQPGGGRVAQPVGGHARPGPAGRVEVHRAAEALGDAHRGQGAPQRAHVRGAVHEQLHLGHPVRLGEHVVRPEPERLLDHVAGGVPRREHHLGRERQAARGAQHREPVEPRHVHVHHGHVEAGPVAQRRLHARQRVTAVARQRHDAAAPDEEELEQGAEVRLVLGEEDARAVGRAGPAHPTSAGS